MTDDVFVMQNSMIARHEGLPPVWFERAQSGAPLRARIGAGAAAAAQSDCSRDLQFMRNLAHERSYLARIGPFGRTVGENFRLGRCESS
jgi:hypothetical protein